jgi:hypothetical protein
MATFREGCVRSVANPPSRLLLDEGVYPKAAVGDRQQRVESGPFEYAGPIYHQQRRSLLILRSKSAT